MRRCLIASCRSSATGAGIRCLGTLKLSGPDSSIVACAASQGGRHTSGRGASGFSVGGKLCLPGFYTCSNGRQCCPFIVCKKDEYQTAAPSSTSDRSCAKLATRHATEMKSARADVAQLLNLAAAMARATLPPSPAPMVLVGREVWATTSPSQQPTAALERAKSTLTIAKMEEARTEVMQLEQQVKAIQGELEEGLRATGPNKEGRAKQRRRT